MFGKQVAFDGKRQEVSNKMNIRCKYCWQGSWMVFDVDERISKGHTLLMGGTINVGTPHNITGHIHTGVGTLHKISCC